MKRVFVVTNENPRWRNVLAFCSKTVSEFAEAGHAVVITLGEPKRNSESSACMWAMLHDLATQVGWRRARWRGDSCIEDGRYVRLSDDPGAARLSAEDFKDVLSAALRKPRMVGGIDGGVVAVGLRTSRMSQRQMGDMIELIGAFGSRVGVEWSDPKERAA